MAMKSSLLKRVLSLVLALVMLIGLMPMQALASGNAETGSGTNELAGKTISILGASISTYTGISNNTAYNSTIGNNAVYYTEGRHGVYANDTWWMQVANDLGLRLLVNNSWSGSSLLYERNGTVGAYVDRCVQLHNNEGEEPDIIGIQMGTNDFQYYKDTLGTADIDYAALITENEDGSFTYATPVTSLEAAAIVLHKISVRYPQAEVYYLNISQRVDGTDELIQTFNADLKQVVEHFGAHIVDIYGSAITMENFDTYIGDGRVHPNKLGMDAYTEAFKRALIENTAYSVETHTVSMSLNGVTADYGDDKIVVAGDHFTLNLTASDSLQVTVTMGGKDITQTAYANGTVTIDAVTADVAITAKSVRTPKDYRWEFNGTDLVCTEGGNTLTQNAGTTTDGVFSKTRYALADSVALLHDQPWVVEWKCSGTFLNSNGSSGARIFTSTDVNAEYNARYIFKSNTNGIIAMGEKDTKGSHNYGIALADHGIDWTELHTYRLENRIAADGSNMIYLFVDGKEIGPMNHYYIGTKDQVTTSDWLSGKDFVFPYMGTDTHGFTNASIDYIQVAECVHSYKNGVCTACGEAVPTLAGKTISILGDSISTYTNVSNNTSYNSTIGSNKVYYSAGTLGVYQEDTWWQQTLDVLGMELCVNNSWSGSAIFGTRAGTVGAYLDRCVQLHNDKTGEEPDIIFIFLGTNDFSYTYDGGELGNYDLGLDDEIDFSTLIQENEDGSFTYEDPTTSPEAYAIMLHKMQQRYPDAEIYCMSLMTRRYPVYSKADVGQPTEFNAKLKEVVDELGAYYIELEGLFSSDPDGFDLYMGDKRVHPNKVGMDLMTEAVVSALLGELAEVCEVSYSLNGVESDNSAAAVLIGGSYTATLSPADTYSNIAVTVTMGGEDVTASCYKDGKITVSKVTGDIAITASAEKAPANYRWELDGGAFVSKGDDENALTLLAGSVSDGVQNSTRYALAENVVLKHDQPWVIEWKAGGDWSGMLLTSTTKSATTGMEFIFRTYNTTGLLALGYYTGSQYNNYGIPLADLELDMNQSHTYRIENRIAGDSSNMVYLLIDGAEIGALNNYYIGGTKDQNATVDWANGQDFTFGYIGSTSHPLKDLKLEYLEVTECVHSYKNGVCTACGEAAPTLAGKTISILGDSISTFADYIPTADGFNLEHIARYPQDNLLTDVNETWWMQVLTELDAKLGINESWRSTEVGNIYDVEVNSGYEGTKACMASLTRIQNLGSNGTPDVILFYGGTNDITQRRTVGTFDPKTAPTEVDLTSVKWNTVADAYVTAIMRMQYYYPDAQIIAMLPTYTSNNTDAVIEKYNSVFAAICEHYGVTYMDLRDCGITTADLPDGTHPNAKGMDYITDAVLNTLLTECDMEQGENVVHSVTHYLTDAESSLGYYKGVSDGKAYVTRITGEDLTVTVTMGGVDITASVYTEGVINIPNVTGDIVITAKGWEKTVYEDHLQQLPESICSDTNLWTALNPEGTYYTASGWGNLSGNVVYSVTIPVNPGDQLWATSFQANKLNGNTTNSSNGIRVTWFDASGVLKAMSPADTYAEFKANGYLTAPEGAVAVNIPMWTGNDSQEIYLLNRDHVYENGICTACGTKGWDTDGDGILEILAIGNSFSVDALEYAYQIAQDLGIEEIVLGNLYIGGCSLNTHATNAAGDLAKYTYYYNDNGTWKTTSNYKISTALESRSWDYVSLQQASNYSGVESTYNEDLTDLIAYVQERSDAKLVWHMTWAYQQNSTHSAFPTYNKDQMTMYNAIVSAVQNKIVTNSDFDLIVPNGTAVQNSRTSLLGDTTTRDGYHMSYDYGRYLTGLMFIKTITGLSVDDIAYAPSGVDAEEMAIAIESVNNASAKPFEVTQSAYVEEEPEIPDEGYIQLKPELHKGAYWYPTDAKNYNVPVADASNSKYYFATIRFTREDLPIGSIIMIDSGWQYRPDGWITDTVQSSRADTTTQSYVVVTEEWWGDYTIRGFNISKVGTPSLEALTADDIHKVFRIYVPADPTVCTCTIQCSDGSVNSECAVCTADLNGCTGSGDIGEPDWDDNLTDEALVFATQGISFQHYIGLQSSVKKSVADQYEEIYAMVDGEKIEGYLYQGVYVFDVQVMAVEMTKEVTITLYGVKDGKTYTGETRTSSVESLALAKLPAYEAAGDKYCTALVDMLKYGTAAQVYFNVDAAMPDANLGDYDKYATTEDPVIAYDNTTTGTGTVAAYTTSLSMQSILEINIGFKKDLTNYEAHVTANGETETYELEAYSGIYVLKIPVGAMNARTEYTVTVHETATGTQVSPAYVISAEGCVKAKLAATDTTADNATLCRAVMRYCDAVIAAFEDIQAERIL